MASFKVTKIIDGDTIRVSPNWVFQNAKGDIIKIRGYRTPLEQEQPFIIKRLKNLLINNFVELNNPSMFNEDSEALMCNVIFNGVNIAKYFPEFGGK
jgi:hypothetical protein